MKKILIPTDFSDNAKKAMDYGFHIANKTKADVVIFHANHIPVISPNTPLSVYNELLKSEEAKITKLAHKLKEEYEERFAIKPTEQKISVHIATGFATDEVVAYTEDNEVDLVVMGTQGAGGLKKMIVGSNTVSIIRSSNTPILAVPSDHEIKDLKKAVLATDFKSNENEKQFDLLVTLCKAFDLKLDILHVKSQSDFTPNDEQIEKGLAIETIFKDIKHEYHILDAANVDDAILKHVEENNIDLIVTIPRKQSFIARLFNTSITSEIAYQAKSPLLTLPNKK